MDNMNRIVVAENALIDAYRALDPSSPSYHADLEAISKLHRELANDIKNTMDHDDKAVDSAIEEDRLEEDKRSNRSRERLDIVKNIVLVGTTAATVGSQLWMFKRSTEKEKDEVLDTTTKRTVVSNGLSGKFFRFFNK